jgi:hypothetical protein
MAKDFNIRRARGTLPGKATQVRADIDVRTGGRQVAQAVAGFGGAIADLGLKWDLIEASTQLNEAEMFSEREQIRLMLELPGLEPSEHAKAYEKSLKTQQGFMPKNRRAAASYTKFLNNFAPQRELDVKNATKAKLKDNKRAVGFEMQQGAIESGNFKRYFKHLEEGKILGVYDAEEVAKYKQATIDGHIAYVKRLEAEAKRQKEIEFATHNPSTYWKLLRRVTADPKSIDETELAAAVGPDSITTDDYKELNRIRESKDEPLKTPRAQLYFNSLDALYEDRDTDAEERMKWDVANEKLVQFFKTTPNPSAKQAAEFYDDLVSPAVLTWFESFGKMLRPKETTPFWRHFGTTEEAALARKKAKIEPVSLIEFNEAVSSIEDEKEAKAYYEKWKNKW